MPNDYYDPQADAQPITRVRASDINALDTAVNAAFEKLPAEGDIKKGKVVYAAAAGTVNAYTATLTYAPSAYEDGMMVILKPNITNTGASTLNLNGLGAKSIKAVDGTALVAGALVMNGVHFLVYNSSTGDFRLCNPATMFSSSSTYATLSGVETLHNKTLESPVLNNAVINFTQDGSGAQQISVTERAKQIVSVFDFLTTAQIADVRAGTASLDLTTAIQAAIDACNAKATTSYQRSRTTLLFPDGIYKITAQLVVKANVNILCDGVIQNSLASGTDFCIQFKAGSACERLVLSANSKAGVQFGDNGADNDIQIGDVRLLSVGESANQIACRFVGYNFTAESLDIDGGNIGLDIGDSSSYPGSDLRIDKVLLYTPSTGLRISTGSEHIHIGHIDIDSANYLGMQIDSCRGVTIDDFDIFFNDADAAYGSFTRGYAVEIGTYSGGGHVENLTMRGRVVNTASVDNATGTALKLSNIDRSQIWLEANNGTLGTGNAHRIVQALEYGSGVGATVSVFGNFASGLTVSSGTVAGTLAYNSGAAWTFYDTPSDTKGDLRAVPQNVQNTAYQCVLADAGKHLIKTDSTARAHTVPPSGTVNFPIGTVLTFVNLGGTTNNLTVTRGGGVAIYRAGTNADITVTPGDMVTLLKVGTDTWQA